MPRKDNTGPEGQGPMTGRGLGSCNSDNEKNVEDRRLRPRLGLRLGRGFRFGRRPRGNGRGRNRI